MAAPEEGTAAPWTCSCLNVPLERRLETAAIFTAMALFPGFLAVSAALLWYDLLYARYVFLAAALWQAFVDGRAARRGGRIVQWVRQMPFWGYVCDYFPSRMIMEAPLDPSVPHIISAHPHG
jgi:hypothetical protein